MQKIYIQTFGCQMNLNDSEIIKSIMIGAGYEFVNNIEEANVILLNTCSVRENAVNNVHNKIGHIYSKIKHRNYKTVFGILGCVAEHYGEKMLLYTNIVNLVVGPDEYRKLPELIKCCFEGESKVAIDLNSKENYNDIIPVRNNNISAWISIMRGCNNFCSYCVVPYVRGRERSRSVDSILREVDYLLAQDIKEITLLGQNVNSYFYDDINFPKLLEAVAIAAPNVRIRFLTSHPKDMTSELIDTIAKYDNICNYIHLPVQSGSNRILEKMNRKYTREHYLSLIREIREKLEEVTISTDIIAGYPTETLEDHQATLKLIKEVNFASAFMFYYSPREGTKAFEEVDDIPYDEKIRRLSEIINTQSKISFEMNQRRAHKKRVLKDVLIEGSSKKRNNQLMGKTKTFHTVVFDNINNKYKTGDIVSVKINFATSKTLKGYIVE